jgi:hypothetical protein
MSDYLFSRDDTDEHGVCRRTFTGALDAAGDFGPIIWRLIIDGREVWPEHKPALCAGLTQVAVFYEELALDLGLESPIAEVAEGSKVWTDEDRARSRERWHRTKRRRQELEAGL